MVVGTPGRLLDHLKRGTLDLSKVEVLGRGRDEALSVRFVDCPCPMAPTKGTEDPRALAFALARARDRARNPRPSTSRKPTRCPQSLRCGAGQGLNKNG